MNDFLFLSREILQGKSVIRATLDLELKKEFLKGRILDLGSGGGDYYSNFIPREESSSYELLDIKKGAAVNFETDVLPYADGTFDTVIFLNVLEHIFNYAHILKEIKRLKKTEGVLIGYVPFLMWYHPDHSDYFRYTHETLDRILGEAGFHEICIKNIYRGPYTASFHMIYSTLPKIIRPLVFSVTYLLDTIFRKLRKENAKRYVLGYYFEAK
jgi:SAM-dependent methyltransferase